MLYLPLLGLGQAGLTLCSGPGGCFYVVVVWVGFYALVSRAAVLPRCQAHGDVPASVPGSRWHPRLPPPIVPPPRGVRFLLCREAATLRYLNEGDVCMCFPCPGERASLGREKMWGLTCIQFTRQSQLPCTSGLTSRLLLRVVCRLLSNAVSSCRFLVKILGI